MVTSWKPCFVITVLPGPGVDVIGDNGIELYRFPFLFLMKKTNTNDVCDSVKTCFFFTAPPALGVDVIEDNGIDLYRFLISFSN